MIKFKIFYLKGKNNYVIIATDEWLLSVNPVIGFALFLLANKGGSLWKRKKKIRWQLFQ
jgi:hypothetical protein